MFGKIASNTLYQIIGKIFGAGTTLILTFVLAERIGAGGYGDFVKVVTFVGFFFLAADFGLNAIFIKNNYDWGILFGLRLLLSVFLILISLIILSFLPYSTTNGYTSVTRAGIYIFLPAIFFQAIITSCNAIFQKYSHYGYATISIFFGSIVSLIILYVSPGLYGGIISLLAGSLVTAGFSLIFVSRHVPISFSISYPLFVSLLIAGLPLGFTLVANLMYSHVDNVILSIYRPTAEVGTYGFAYKIFETILVLPTFVMNAFYPILLATFKMNKKEFTGLIARSSLYLVAFSLLIMLGVWFCAPLIEIFQKQFIPSIYLVTILSISLPIFFVSSLLMWSLIVIGKQWLLAKIYVFGLMVNIFLNILLIPRYGAEAAAWVTVIGESVILILLLIAFKKYANKYSY